MVPDTPQILFLAYFSRSGSTFLSSRLDRYGDVGVTVESAFMRTLLLKKGELRRAAGPGEVYGMLENEARFANLGLSRAALSEHLKPGGAYGVGEVARAILGAYFAEKKPGARVWVVKEGGSGFLVNAISRELPEARFLHVIRDGRAVLNSGLNAVRPYGEGERMARDPLAVARVWSGFVDGVDAFRAARPERCLECRYEDLMADEEGELRRLRRSLGLPEEAPRSTGEGEGYYEAMPEKERSIHRLVSGGAVRGRVDAWRDELGRGDRLVFEYRARRSLRRHGYGAEAPGLPALLRDRDFLASYVSSLARRVGSWRRLARNPVRLLYVIRTTALRLKDRLT
ncbi:hypothetical protein GBA65_03190 [Rubrobacter marinus]|uniref:Sulfotransferase n=1 Tax=Rubrobacter marinus TaxID=2653852 RepID=A0A6G8PT45_9ACTN|nr:sulfotransferase [Rubrobacter marinus]QIN77678.1 hypothetical protein GBA65_03190 [Rubrobacter marinus]